MNSEDIKLVTELIEKKDSDQLKEVIKDLHPADIAELCCWTTKRQPTY